jgi:hypothetical protein
MFSVYGDQFFLLGGRCNLPTNSTDYVFPSKMGDLDRWVELQIDLVELGQVWQGTDRLSTGRLCLHSTGPELCRI